MTISGVGHLIIRVGSDYAALRVSPWDGRACMLEAAEGLSKESAVVFAQSGELGISDYGWTTDILTFMRAESEARLCAAVRRILSGYNEDVLADVVVVESHNMPQAVFEAIRAAIAAPAVPVKQEEQVTVHEVSTGSLAERFPEWFQ